MSHLLNETIRKIRAKKWTFNREYRKLSQIFLKFRQNYIYTPKNLSKLHFLTFKNSSIYTKSTRKENRIRLWQNSAPKNGRFSQPAMISPGLTSFKQLIKSQSRHFQAFTVIKRPMNIDFWLFRKSFCGNTAKAKPRRIPWRIIKSTWPLIFNQTVIQTNHGTCTPC